jgi:hypothetical protein
MLANTLVTNEIKNASGVEIEFQRTKQGEGWSEYAQIGELPSQPHRMRISHQETGSGVNRRRRSVVRFDRTYQSYYDTTRFVKDSAYIVIDRSIGDQSDDAWPKLLLANIMSFCATTGAGTTVLFDGTGTGASNLLSGGI